jgi:hypothetical protein
VIKLVQTNSEFILWPEFEISAYIGFVSMGQFGDEIVSVGHLRRHDDLLQRGRLVAEQNISPDGRGQ